MAERTIRCRAGEGQAESALLLTAAAGHARRLLPYHIGKIIADWNAPVKGRAGHFSGSVNRRRGRAHPTPPLSTGALSAGPSFSDMAAW